MLSMYGLEMDNAVYSMKLLNVLCASKNVTHVYMSGNFVYYVGAEFILPAELIQHVRYINTYTDLKDDKKDQGFGVGSKS